MDFIDFETMDSDQQNEEFNFSGDENNGSGKPDGNFVEEVDNDFIDNSEQ